MPPARRPARPTRPNDRRPRAPRPPKRNARALTPVEGLLWEMLRDGRLNGLAFARRHPHRRFVLDFFSPDVGVAVMLLGARDGEGEGAGERARKAERDAQAIEAEGMVVLRVSEARVMTDLPDVLAEIVRASAGRRGAWTGGRAGA